MENDDRSNSKILNISDFKSKEAAIESNDCCKAFKRDDIPELIRLRTEEIAQLLVVDVADVKVRLVRQGDCLAIDIILSESDCARLRDGQSKVLKSLRYVVESLAFTHDFSVQVRVFSENSPG